MDAVIAPEMYESSQQAVRAVEAVPVALDKDTPDLAAAEIPVRAALLEAKTLVRAAKVEQEELAVIGVNPAHKVTQAARALTVTTAAVQAELLAQAAVPMVTILSKAELTSHLIIKVKLPAAWHNI
jgi:hypothetical protein